MVRSLIGYFRGGADLGLGSVAFVTTPHRQALLRDPVLAHAFSRGDMVLFDAALTLEACLREGKPDPAAFATLVAGPVRDMLARPGIAGVRAYGDMAGMLWADGKSGLAVILESYWDELIAELQFDLYCAYPVDVLDPRFARDAVDGVLGGHTHVAACTGNDAALDKLIAHVMTEALPSAVVSARVAGSASRPWPMLPNAEARILWLRENAPAEAESIIDRARALATHTFL